MNKLKISIAIFLLGLTLFINSYVSDMFIADMAVKQLEDSDASYLFFKSSMYTPYVTWTAYFVIVLLMYGKQIIDWFRKGK